MSIGEPGLSAEIQRGRHVRRNRLSDRQVISQRHAELPLECMNRPVEVLDWQRTIETELLAQRLVGGG
jgi:hypothetical protein